MSGTFNIIDLRLNLGYLRKKTGYGITNKPVSLLKTVKKLWALIIALSIYLKIQEYDDLHIDSIYCRRYAHVFRTNQNSSINVELHLFIKIS